VIVPLSQSRDWDWRHCYIPTRNRQAAKPPALGPNALHIAQSTDIFSNVPFFVEYAHSRGVIHRDLKPANIILGRHGETLVVDWGWPRPSAGEQTIAPSSSGSSETLPGSALGTPAYRSPEQAGGDLDRLGPRSDVYSLGATLYCLLTGRPPFEGEDNSKILRRVQAGDDRAPREVDPALDEALEAVCTKAVATKPADRYATCWAQSEKRSTFRICSRAGETLVPDGRTSSGSLTS
jgi:eukaryotic-like serine/threonine-protein kinase